MVQTSKDGEKAFINGLCCGSASAFQVGLATKEDVENVKERGCNEMN